MAAKVNQSIKEIEKEINSTGYRVIYEKGNFQSGHCIVQDKKVIVVNKFLSDKNRLLILKEIFQTLLKTEGKNSSTHDDNTTPG